MKALFLVLMALAWGNSEAQSLAWSKTVGDTSMQSLKAMRVDAQGNILLFGTFQTYPLENGVHRKAFGGVDLFLHKLDALGNTLWFRHAGSGFNADLALDMDVDSVGNAFILGLLGDNLGAVPMAILSGDTDTLWMDGMKGDNMFFAKYDPSGKALWARQFEKENDATLMQIRISGGKVMVGGEFNGMARILGQSDSITASSYKALLAELSGDGALLSLSTVDSAEQISLIRADRKGNRYFGLRSKVPNGVSMLEKRLPSGEVAWRRSLQNPGAQGFLPIRDVALDRAGNVFVGGEFNGYQAQFRLEDGRDTLLESKHPSPQDIYLLKLDSNGRMQWILIGKSGFGRMSDLIAAPNGSLNLLANLQGRTLKLDEDGKALQDFQAISPGTVADYTLCAALDATGSILYGFSFSGAQNLLGKPIASAGGQDIQLYRVEGSSSSVPGKRSPMKTRIRPDSRPWWKWFTHDGRKRAILP